MNDNPLRKAGLLKTSQNDSFKQQKISKTIDKMEM